MTRTTLAAAVVVAMVALGGAFFLTQRGQPVVVGPQPTASATVDPSQPAIVVAPSPTRTATASPTATPILWTEASLKDDWPGPVRPEPAGGAIVLPLRDDAADLIPDPVGDTASAAHPWVDIRELQGTNGRIFLIPGSNPPLVAPGEQWIAYGVVVDDDRDGIPDRRFGIDNIPATAPGNGDRHRAWITDLHTGRTEVGAGNYTVVGETYFDTYYPGSAPYIEIGAHLGFGADVTNGGTGPVPLGAFYAWASVIQDGRVVATDYAPDVGWLLSTEFTADVDPTPSPVPGHTPQVEDDPDVPGGRLWTTTVVNNSPDPATLFVAEDVPGSNAMGRLVGTVTPSVVPPKATVKVTFAIPPAGSRGWSIFVNPGPNGGGLNSPDVPAYGEFHITADGNTGWRSLIP